MLALGLGFARDDDGFVGWGLGGSRASSSSSSSSDSITLRRLVRALGFTDGAGDEAVDEDGESGITAAFLRGGISVHSEQTRSALLPSPPLGAQSRFDRRDASSERSAF